MEAVSITDFQFTHLLKPKDIRVDGDESRETLHLQWRPLPSTKLQRSRPSIALTIFNQCGGQKNMRGQR